MTQMMFNVSTHTCRTKMLHIVGIIICDDAKYHLQKKTNYVNKNEVSNVRNQEEKNTTLGLDPKKTATKLLNKGCSEVFTAVLVKGFNFVITKL